MTADEFAAEKYRQDRRKARRWWPVIVAGLVALLVTSFRLAAAVMNRACR